MAATQMIYAERTVTLTRVLKAPRDSVWRAWTDMAMLKEWWGPEQFTNPVVEGEIKGGGTLHITMHGPKDTPIDIDMPRGRRDREIRAGCKLVFENEPVGRNGERLMENLTTVTFSDHPDGTLMEMTTSAKALVPMAAGMLQGMDQG